MGCDYAWDRDGTTETHWPMKLGNVRNGDQSMWAELCFRKANAADTAFQLSGYHGVETPCVSSAVMRDQGNQYSFETDNGSWRCQDAEIQNGTLHFAGSSHIGSGNRHAGAIGEDAKAAMLTGGIRFYILTD